MEEEIVGRRSFWRRQRKRESELTTQENKVAKMLMEDEHVTIHVLREYLDGIYESKSKCFFFVRCLFCFKILLDFPENFTKFESIKSRINICLKRQYIMFNDSPKFIKLIQLIAAFLKILVFSYTNRFVYVKKITDFYTRR